MYHKEFPQMLQRCLKTHCYTTAHCFLTNRPITGFVFFCLFCHSWVLYEKPGFQGRSIALEEGGIELTNMWADPGLQTEPQNTSPAVVGSIRLVVCVSEINTHLNLV